VGHVASVQNDGQSHSWVGRGGVGKPIDLDRVCLLLLPNQASSESGPVKTRTVNLNWRTGRTWFADF
jgi:hypothetical protein